MRIAQLTLIGRNYNNNFGATLQAYALHRTLLSMGYEVEIIDFIPSKYTLRHKLREILKTKKEKGLKYLLKRSTNWTIERILKKDFKNGLASDLRSQYFSEFKKNYFYFTKKTYRTFEELKELDSIYDAYIVGSDLVWSPRWMDENQLKCYLLAFTKSGLKISYAASIGEKIPKWACKIFKKYLPEFNAVSVRERESAEAIKICTGLNSKITLDPCILLDERSWGKIVRKPPIIPDKPYILVYDLYKSQEILYLVKKLNDKLNLEIVTYSRKTPTSFYDYGPKEFLWLIKNAEFIVTSSFHGAVFAVLFERPFYAINPEPYAPSSRISDFLDVLNLRRLFLESMELQNPMIESDIDWIKVKEKVESERLESLNFLEKALEKGIL